MLIELFFFNTRPFTPQKVIIIYFSFTKTSRIVVYFKMTPPFSCIYTVTVIEADIKLAKVTNN